jgi:hypothetical protein
MKISADILVLFISTGYAVYYLGGAASLWGSERPDLWLAAALCLIISLRTMVIIFLKVRATRNERFGKGE